ncbi:hypothetical protein ACTFIW_005967 [Dictyostelium discoideum]
MQQHMIKEFIYPYALPKHYGSSGKPVEVTQSTPKIFTPLTVKDLTLKNRIVVSPMCQYSSIDGFMSDYHLVHYGTFARGGASMIVMEATAVSDIGRITYADSGLWKDEQMEPLKRIVNFIRQFDCKTSIQIAHAGRKASTHPPFLGKRNESIPIDDPNGHGWLPIGPSDISWGPGSTVPKEMTLDDINIVINQFRESAQRCLKIGFDMIEIHGAHGYLISSFLSPTSNKRTDQYGGDFNGRIKFLIDIVKAVRTVWPMSKPLSVRLSCEEWVKDGWHIDDTVRLAKILESLGVDILDCSSGGNSIDQKIQGGPLYQVKFAEEIKRNTNLITAAVGLINKPNEADSILETNKCDIVMMARAFLRDPFWPLHCADELDIDTDVSLEYSFLKPRMMRVSDLKQPIHSHHIDESKITIP